jgi:hypothetical protein
VVDPDLTLTVPPHVTAATGVYAMAHCVEAYTNRRAHPAIDLYALEGVRLVGRHLPRAIADGVDGEARAGLALASRYGGYCLEPINTAAGHAVAYPLGTRHHIAHAADRPLRATRGGGDGPGRSATCAFRTSIGRGHAAHGRRCRGGVYMIVMAGRYGCGGTQPTIPIFNSSDLKPGEALRSMEACDWLPTCCNQ